MSKIPKHYFADRDIQILLGSLLRIGVIVSMIVIILGGLLYMFTSRTTIVDYSEFDASRLEYSSIATVLSGISTMDGRAVIQFGILLLVFTPVLRVVFAVFSFIIERDYLYVTIGLIVLSVILYSLSNGLAH